jgi:hypothetical protein
MFHNTALKNHLSVLVVNLTAVEYLVDDRSLDELPDQVFVALGRRGMEPLILKECTYDCDGQELILIEPPGDKKIPSKGDLEVDEDWLVECAKCNRQFIIRCKVHYLDGERIDTRVNLIDDNGKDLGWLGSY